MEKWHAMSGRSAEQILRRSGQDKSVDLTGKKSIRHRKKKKGTEAAFRLPVVTPVESLFNVISDASIPVFFVVTIVSAFLGQLFDAIIELSVLALLIVVSAMINFYSRKRICDMSRELLPRVKIRTDSGVIVCPADKVEIGDVIVFRQGDVLAVDGRLLESRDLVMLEAATDRITADKTVKSFRKDADVIYDSEMFAASFDNMVYAGSTVASGSGSAVVTSIGEDTRAGRVYSGINLATELVMPHEWTEFCKRTRRFSLAVLVGIIPAMLFWIFTSGQNERSSIGIFQAFVLFVTLAMTSMCDLSSVASVIIFSDTVKKLKNEHDVSVIRPSVIENISDTDIVLILNPNCAADCRQLVRYSLFSGCDNPDASVRKDILGLFSVLGEAAKKGSATADQFSVPIAIIREYINDGMPAESVVNKKYKIISVKAEQPFQNCFTVIVESSDEERNERDMITLATGPDIIDYCSKYRASGGESIDLTNEKLNMIRKTVETCSDCGQKVYVLLTASESEHELTFEALFGIGIFIPEDNTQEIEKLEELGVSTVMMLRENNSATRRFASETGIASDPRFVIIGSASHPKLSETEAEMGRVFVGFGQDGLDALIRTYTEQNKNVLSILSDSAQLKSVASTGITSSVARASQDSVGVCSAIKFSRPDSENTKHGITAIRSAITTCRSAMLKLRMYSEYLLISSIMRLSTVIFPLILGVDISIPSILTLMFTGLFGDLAGLLVISSSSVVPESRNIISVKKTGMGPVLRRFGMTVSGILSGLFVFVTAQLFLTSGIIEEEIMAWYTFCAIAFSQLSLIGSLFIRWKRRGCNNVFNFVYPLVALISVVFFTGIPVLSKYVVFPLGLLPYSEGAEFAGAVALIPAVLTVGFVLVSDMIGNYSSKGEENEK